MTAAQRFALASDAELTLSGDEGLLLKLSDETMFSLNATGARIAELIASGLDIDAIVAVLVEEYRASASDVKRDVAHLVEALLSGGLIVEVGEDEPHDR
jgi:hypothetical protein